MSNHAEFLPLPWHRPVWDRLQSARQAGRLPHALLFSGAEGLGKHEFAIAFARSLLCRDPSEDGRPCGVCRSCHLFGAGTHPDYRRIEPEEPGKAIRIDSVREFVGKEALTTQLGGYKVVVIEPADAMNTAAANSLLKTLEEPTAWTLMILITSRPSRLPATIRSRCQGVGFGLPPKLQAIEWLQGVSGDCEAELLLGLSGGSPLLARRYAAPEVLVQRARMLDEFVEILAGRQDPVAIAARWEALDLSQVLQWVTGWVIDMLRLKSTDEPPRLYNPDQIKRLNSLAQAIEFKEIYGLLDRLYEASRLKDSQLNPLMLLEGLLLAWAGNARSPLTQR